MPIPIALATVAACGSLVTSVKSSWELSRMIRKRMEAKQAEEDAARIYRSLRRAFHHGIMSEAEYDRWYEKFLVAAAEKDLSGLRKIRTHLRILYDGALSEKRSSVKRSRQSSRTESSHERYRHDGSKRRHPEPLNTHRQTMPPVPDPPQRFQDIEWVTSASSIEYSPLSGRENADVVRLARLQRRSCVSYQRGDSSETSSKTHSRRRVSTSRPERGRSRTRRALDADDDPGYASSGASWEEA